MSEAKQSRFNKWLESGEAQLHPLTFPQRELWEASPAPPADVSNHICCVLNIRGLISADASVRSFQRVVDRQEVLRLSFLPGKKGPVQLIRKHSEPVMRFSDVSPETPAAEIEELLVDVLQAVAALAAHEDVVLEIVHHPRHAPVGGLQHSTRHQVQRGIHALGVGSRRADMLATRRAGAANRVLEVTVVWNTAPLEHSGRT